MTKIEIAELCKGLHCVDLGESFPTHIYLQNLVSIQPRTSPVKFAASRDTGPDAWGRGRWHGAVGEVDRKFGAADARSADAVRSDVGMSLRLISEILTRKDGLMLSQIFRKWRPAVATFLYNYYFWN